MREQAIIRRYFAGACGNGVDIGIGDDAAVVSLVAESKLAISTDTLNAGVHFFSDADPYYLARKAAAVSLSDMAAMGATPLWMTVALSSPPTTPDWFEAFSRGLKSLTEAYNFSVIGGDLTRADILSITTTALGRCLGKPLTRFAAAIDDDIWLSGCLGGAAHAVGVRRGKMPAAKDMSAAENCLHNPTPRTQLGSALADIAHAAMDLSDGLLSSAQTIAEQSEVCLRLQREAIPAAASLSALSADDYQQCLFYGGDDYELLFTAPPVLREAITALATAVTPLSRIGTVVAGSGVVVLSNGDELHLPEGGYEHTFA